MCSRKNPDLVFFHLSIWKLGFPFRKANIQFAIHFPIANGSKNNVYGCYKGWALYIREDVKIENKSISFDSAGEN